MRKVGSRLPPAKKSRIVTGVVWIFLLAAFFPVWQEKVRKCVVCRRTTTLTTSVFSGGLKVIEDDTEFTRTVNRLHAPGHEHQYVDVYSAKQNIAKMGMYERYSASPQRFLIPEREELIFLRFKGLNPEQKHRYFNKLKDDSFALFCSQYIHDLESHSKIVEQIDSY